MPHSQLTLSAGQQGGELFEMSLKGPAQAQYYVTDLGNGTYQALYMCSKRGVYKLKVTLNGANVGMMLQDGQIKASPVGTALFNVCIFSFLSGLAVWGF